MKSSLNCTFSQHVDPFTDWISTDIECLEVQFQTLNVYVTYIYVHQNT